MQILHLHHHLWILLFGILGNIASIFVFLAPVSTFIQIYRAKSTLDFHSVTYILTLFSCMLWVYYGFIKKNATLLISINSIGISMETIYILIFLVFASNQAKRHTLLKEYFLCTGGFSLIFLVSWYLFSDVVRVNIVGWINMAISVAALASPLNIVLHVLQTRSVEFLPIYFSFFFTLSEIMWCTYGLLLKDFYIAMPNIFGFFLGFIQIWLYVIYWRPNSVAPENENVADHVMDVEMLRMPADQLVQHDVDSRRSLSNGETETNLEAN